MKSVQGDSGHARAEMVSDVYSHIIDEDRRVNAQKFEEQFYQAKSFSDTDKTMPMPKFESAVELYDPLAVTSEEKIIEPEEESKPDDNAELIQKLLSNPQMAELLKSLVKSM